ncbi:MAG: hypothetical protein WCQ60_00730 [bacterium]
MTKIKSYPDAAALIIRLMIGMSYLPLLIYSWPSAHYQPIWVSALLIMYFLCSLLLVFGLFTRTVAVIFFSLTLILPIISLASGRQSVPRISLLAILLDAKLWMFVSVWLLGAGKYSLDNKFFNKTTL